MTFEQASAHGATLLARVRELRIHNPRSTAGRYLTASVGVGWGVPGRQGGEEALVAAAVSALEVAQGEGGDRVRTATLPRVARRQAAPGAACGADQVSASTPPATLSRWVSSSAAIATRSFCPRPAGSDGHAARA